MILNLALQKGAGKEFALNFKQAKGGSFMMETEELNLGSFGKINIPKIYEGSEAPLSDPNSKGSVDYPLSDGSVHSHRTGMDPTTRRHADANEPSPADQEVFNQERTSLIVGKSSSKYNKVEFNEQGKPIDYRKPSIELFHKGKNATIEGGGKIINIINDHIERGK